MSSGNIRTSCSILLTLCVCIHNSSTIASTNGATARRRDGAPDLKSNRLEYSVDTIHIIPGRLDIQLQGVAQYQTSYYRHTAYLHIAACRYTKSEQLACWQDWPFTFILSQQRLHLRLSALLIGCEFPTLVISFSLQLRSDKMATWLHIMSPRPHLVWLHSRCAFGLLALWQKPTQALSDRLKPLLGRVCSNHFCLYSMWS